MSSDPHEKNLIASLINSKMKELNAIVAIMITDTWVGDAAPGSPLPCSLQSPSPGRHEALMVAIWGPDGVATCGMQMYRRCANGKVEFEELKWAEPSTEFRFARSKMGQKDNVLGMSAGSRKGYIN